MHFFANPSLPKKNLIAGAILLTLSAFLIGGSVERIIWTDTASLDYAFVVLWVVVAFVAIKIFRQGLASVPPDPKNQHLNTRASNDPAA